MNIVVLAGGLSTERDVSFKSGDMVCKALRGLGHNVLLLDVFLGYHDQEEDISDIFEHTEEASVVVSDIPDIAADIDAFKASRKDQSNCFFGPNVIELCRMADITFVALHGSVGENGKLQAAFDLLGIKYTGCNSFGCALSMNKLVTKQIYKMSGVPTPRGTHLTKETKDLPLSELGYYLPLVVKPCENGSSIGVYICHTEEEYNNAVRESFEKNPDEELVIEPYIKGREFASAVIAGKALPLVEIIPKDGVFNYENKYQAGGAQEICPPVSIDEETQQRMMRAGEEAFAALRMDVYARADFIIDDEDGEFYSLEMNALPGMTAASLLPKAAKAAGIEYNELCERIIEESMNARYR